MARRDAVEAALAAVPDPIPATAVPNGVVRAVLAEDRSRAVGMLARAAAAGTRLDGLDDLRTAVRYATTVSAGYAAITDDLTREDALADRPAIREEITALRERRRVVGEVDAPTIALHSTVTECLRAAGRAIDDPGDHGSGNRSPAVGERAADLATAEAFVADAAHLYDRFVAARETRPVRQPLERAATHPVLVDVVSPRVRFNMEMADRAVRRFVDGSSRENLSVPTSGTSTPQRSRGSSRRRRRG